MGIRSNKSMTANAMLHFVILFAFVFALVVAGVAEVGAADDYFKVISMKGNVELQQKAKNKWEKVKISQKICESDKIRLSEGASLNLVHSTGKTMFLNTAKEYNIAQLMKMTSRKSDGVSSKLARAVVEDINKADNVMTGDNYKRQASLTGAGVRGIFGVRALAPRKTHYTTGKLTFTWFSAGPDAEYTFVITSIDNTPLYTVTTKDTLLELNIDEINLKRDVYYFWSVSSGDEYSRRPDNYSFKVLPESKVSMIRDSVGAIERELGADDPAFCQIVLARFYEGNSMIEDARKSYDKAIDLAPEVASYVEIYRMFIESNFSSR